MKLSVEIVDYIFSFLAPHRETLIACSKDPVLLPIVERHLYHFITVYFDKPRLDDEWRDFEPDRLYRFISERPHMPHYVRILHLEFHKFPLERINSLDQFAKTLSKFSVLEGIKVNTTFHERWPDSFRAALEDCLNLPTLKELHLVDRQCFPCCFVDNHKNIENLILSGPIMEWPSPQHQSCVSTLPKLNSLTVLNSVLPTSIKVHLKELRSLKCAASGVDQLTGLLGMCWQTLNKLDIDLSGSQYQSCYVVRTKRTSNDSGPHLPPVLLNLQQLTLRATITMDEGLLPKRSWSYLPSAANIINSFASSVQHLVLEIDISLVEPSNLAIVNFSPLAVLGSASLSIPLIDMYIHTGILPSRVTLARFLSSLEDNEDVMKSIKEGNLVIHSEETAPDYVQRRDTTAR